MKKLKLDHSRVFVSEKYISDGKVLIVRDRANPILSRQADLKPYLYVKAGTYSGKAFESEHLPDMEMVLSLAKPSEKTERLSAETETLLPIRGGSAVAARVVGATFASYLDTAYWPLYELGPAFSKGKNEAITVRDNDGELVAVIMPMRLNHTLDNYEFPAKEETKEESVSV